MTDQAATVVDEELAPQVEEAATDAPEELATSTDAAETTAEPAPAETTDEPDKHQKEINRNVRKRYEAERKAAELEARLNDLESAQRQVDSNIGAEPQLTDSDVDYDTEKLAAKLRDYYSRKAKVDTQNTLLENEQTAVINRQQDGIRKMEATYDIKADEFRKSNPGYDAVFADFIATSQNPSTGRAVLAADNSPAIINFLGNNLAKVEELNGMSPEAAAVAIGKLDAQLAKAPDKTISNAPPPIDNNLSGLGSQGGDDFNKSCPNAEFV